MSSNMEVELWAQICYQAAKVSRLICIVCILIDAYRRSNLVASIHEYLTAVDIDEPVRGEAFV